MKLPFILVLLLLVFSSHGALYNAKEHQSFWRENYTVLLPEEDALVAQVQKIFKAIRDVAGSHPGKSPSLLVISETPYGFSLPISLPDGGIVISRAIIDRLYESGPDFESKIAFVLGHELAHVYSEDFWHAEFFRLLVNYQDNNSRIDQGSDNFQLFLDNRSELVKKEISADEHGLLYMMLAGFNPSVIVENRQYQSFFDEWNEKVSGIKGGNFKPLVSQLDRSLAVEARLDLVLKQSTLYQAGLLHFIAEDYMRAIALFESYARIFPSREVYHNLALSYHFAAISHYTPDGFVTQSIPIKFSYVIDPVERLFSFARRSSENEAEKQYKRLLQRAIDNYELSLRSDENYLPASINLATAYIGKGANYKAIGLLLEATERNSAPGLLNNLAVAYEMIGDNTNAVKSLEQAIDEFSDLDAVYNIGRLLYLSGNIDEATQYWDQYLKVDHQSHFARLLVDVMELESDTVTIKGQREKLDNVEVNLLLDKLPEEWQIKQDEILEPEGFRMRYINFNNGVNLVGENNRVKMLVASDGYQGSSRSGIRFGDNKSKVLEVYGYPGKTISTPTGQIFSYRNRGISFQFEGDKVISWLLY